MNLFELIRYRRSIRKYEQRQIPREDLERIIEAGLYAPNAGGGQRSMIVALRDPKLTETVGKMNVGRLDRSRLSGSFVSKEQPSIIDDPTIKSGFYGAPTVCVIFAQGNFLYSIPDAFCCAENMVLAATELGISSCIIARGEETFDSDYGRQLMADWGVPQGYVARCFVLLGYCKGDYPKEKPRKPGRYNIIGLLSLFFLLASCGGHRAQSDAGQGDTIPMKYARNLTMVKYADRTEVTIRNPWDTTTVLHRYTLISEGNSSHSGTPVHIPLRRAGVFTAVHCGLIKELGMESSIRGICEIEYINIPSIRQAVSEGRVANFGNAMEPTIEVIMDAQPDGLLISPFENSGGYGRVERLGIPIIECADYMEYGPLARAEWVKFYGLLFGQYQRADSLFRAVESRYIALREQADAVAHRPTLIVEKPYSGVWHVPGGNSTMGILYHDAGADYLFSDRKQSGSLVLSAETIFEVGQSADFWLIKYNQAHALTLHQLQSDYPLFARFHAFQTGNVFGCNQAVSRFYEETPYHPDLLLADLVQIFHPELGIKPEKSYFCKVEP